MILLQSNTASLQICHNIKFTGGTKDSRRFIPKNDFYNVVGAVSLFLRWGNRLLLCNVRYDWVNRDLYRGRRPMRRKRGVDRRSILKIGRVVVAVHN